MVKEFISIIVAMSMAFTSGACGSTEENNKEKSLYDHGIEIVSLLEEMSENESYMQLYSSDPETLETISAVSDGDFSEPKAVYKINFPENIFSEG